MKQLVGLALFLLLILVLISVAGAVFRSLFGGRRRGGRLPYRRKDYLLSAAERSFYEVLRAALGGEVQMVIFPKVRMIDLFLLPRRTVDARLHFNRVVAKHVDFVICDRQDLRPLLVIELDDASHGSADRRDRDSFVDRAMGDAGLPILHMPCQWSYSTQQVAQHEYAAIASGSPQRR